MRHVSKEVVLRGTALLDFGCGSGRWVDFFASRGFRYSGVDISTEMLRIARARHPAATFARIENDRVPHPERSFDVVCSIAAIHHNPYERQEQIISELARVLRPGGHVVLFEAVGMRATSGGSVFPRPRQDWAALMTRAEMKSELYRATRYSIVRSAARSLVRRIPGARSAGWGAWATGPARPAWQRWVDRLDVLVDPYLGSMLPAESCRRALMVFRKIAEPRA